MQYPFPTLTLSTKTLYNGGQCHTRTIGIVCLQRPAQILSGKTLADTIETDLKKRIAHVVSQGKRPPHLAVVLVGDNPASLVYVKRKQQACERVGIHSSMQTFGSSVTEATLIRHLNHLNDDQAVDGILVQLPLPPHISLQTILETVAPTKDVDGFHPLNLGRLAQKNPFLRPCTPYGIMQLLETTGVPLRGLAATVIGTSMIVGRPMGLELLMAECTVTLCNTATRDLKGHVARADLLVSAAGKPGLVPGEWIKQGAIVIDVGMNRQPYGDDPMRYRLVGDIDFESAKNKASWITPVPGGVGPMTIASLLKNTFFAYEFSHFTLE